MANYCTTTYRFVGNKEDLNKAYELLNKLKKQNNNKQEFEITKLLAKLNIDIKEKEYRHIDTRGYVYSFHLKDDILSLVTCTAHEQICEIPIELLKMFPSLNFYYYAQNQGDGIYMSNDVENRFFKVMDEDVQLNTNFEETSKEVRLRILFTRAVCNMKDRTSEKMGNAFEELYFEVYGEKYVESSEK